MVGGRDDGVGSGQNGGMPKSKRKRTPKTVLRLPDLEQSKSAVLKPRISEFATLI